MDLKEKVIALDAKLKEIADLKAQVAKYKKEFTDKTESITASVKTYELEVENLKKEITKECVSSYEKDNTKKEFVGGLKIRNSTVLDYKEEEALAWAKKSESCLSLDKTAFKAIAKTGTLSFVKIDKVPGISFPSEIKIEE